ncbi:MAG: 50S ribosomal protein L6 [Alphaproteobacteria bacterium]|nr:50S ribosomal protein L6 [Alphaproteobacteria bacterium]MCD8570427.1 50S ribosomal protein L6 [Alphaproteobacteria bacterium]
MSRIGKYPVELPDGVEAQVNGQDVRVKGKLGELSMTVHDDVSVALEDVANDDGKTSKVVRLQPKSDTPFAKQIWPTMRTLVSNMVVGVSEGYKKDLEIKGVGYRANLQGQTLVMTLGFSHEVRFDVPQGIKVEVDKQVAISISGIDKQQVGQVAAKIRGFKPPEPYKGKGIRYANEYILKKEGKKK